MGDPKFAAKNRETFVNGLAGTQKMCANNRNQSPKNGLDIWTFVLKTCVISVVAWYGVTSVLRVYGINIGR